ncbi:hypothetical protein [Paenibacillus thiaminolyticus]|nr:hypothetical protein [Paenibacillus thiaminolyticus]
MQQLFPLQQLLQLLPLRWLRALRKLRSLPLSTDKLASPNRKNGMPLQMSRPAGAVPFFVTGMKDKMLYIT